MTRVFSIAKHGFGLAIIGDRFHESMLKKMTRDTLALVVVDDRVQVGQNRLELQHNFKCLKITTSFEGSKMCTVAECNGTQSVYSTHSFLSEDSPESLVQATIRGHQLIAMSAPDLYVDTKEFSAFLLKFCSATCCDLYVRDAEGDPADKLESKLEELLRRAETTAIDHRIVDFVIYEDGRAELRELGYTCETIHKDGKLVTLVRR